MYRTLLLTTLCLSTLGLSTLGMTTHAMAQADNNNTSDDAITVKGLNDPTKPKNFTVKKLVAAATSAVQPISITAIFSSPKHHYAVIDGKTLKQGDSVREYVVKSINNQEVVLARTQGGKTQLKTLSVFEEEVKSYAQQ